MHSTPNNPDDAVQYWISRLEATDIGDERWLEAVEALHALGFEVIPTMIEALANKKLSVHVGVGNALKKLGSTAFYDLIEALKHEDPSVRQHAAQLLYGSAVRDDAQITDAVTALVQALEDADCFVRQWAAIALGAIGPAACPAVPVLTQGLLDDVPEVRQAASDALDAIQATREPPLL